MERSLGDGGMPLLAQLGVTFERYGNGWAEASWVPTDLAMNPFGSIHGGVSGVIHDAAMNFAVSATLEKGDRCATLEFKVSTMRGGAAGDQLSVRAEVVRVSSQIAYLQSTVSAADGRPVSTATGTFFIRRKPSQEH